MKKGNVLELKDLSVDFMTVRGIVYAVQGVDLEVKQGEKRLGVQKQEILLWN